jgi:hypothetical protein
MSKVITTDGAFSKAQKDMLEVIVDMIIPAEDEMPGAADAEIFASILIRMEESGPAVAVALNAINELSVQQSGETFLQLNLSDRQAVINAFRSGQPELTQLLQLNTVASYYQDDRVMTELGLDARPPHPGGYEVEKTDWSILDPVRAKEKIYRMT